MKIKPWIIAAASLFCSASVFAATLPSGEGAFKIGIFNAHQGEQQRINMEGLLGNLHSLTQQTDTSMLLGASYLFKANALSLEPFSFGFDISYLAKTRVKGNIAQELAYTNLSYQYDVANIPIYAVIQAETKILKTNSTLLLHAGFGPNIIQTSNYSETPLDNITQPNNAFKGSTRVVLSGMLGAGIRMNNAIKGKTIDINYRFYYLGEGKLGLNKPQVLTSLTTGSAYAHALIASILI